MATDPEPNNAAGGFQATIGAEVRALQHSQWQALSGWYDRYKPPLVTHLRYKFRLPVTDAEAVFHDFLYDKIIQKEIIKQYDFGRGKKFRNFILTALDNYLKDTFKKQNRLSYRDPDSKAFEVAEAKTEADLDRDWARALLATAADRLKTYYEDRHQPDRWLIFEQRIFLPRLTGSRPATVGELIDRCGLRSPAEVSQRLARAKETFETFLLETISDARAGRPRPEIELNELRQIWRQGDPSHHRPAAAKNRDASQEP